MRATLDIYHSEYNDFVSDLTWITPVVLDTSDGFENSTILGFIATSEHDGFKDGGDEIPGSSDDIIDSDDPVELIFTNINYGEVKIWGCDASMYAFISKQWTLDLNFSYLGTKHFYNFLTKDYDPINAPKWKGNASLQWNLTLGDLILNLRYVEAFDWSDGLWSGIIGRYNILDLFYTYHVTDNLDINISALNLNNDIHKELIGGALIGRQIIMRFTSTF